MGHLWPHRQKSPPGTSAYPVVLIAIIRANVIGRWIGCKRSCSCDSCKTYTFWQVILFLGIWKWFEYILDVSIAQLLVTFSRNLFWKSWVSWLEKAVAELIKNDASNLIVPLAGACSWCDLSAHLISVLRSMTITTIRSVSQRSCKPRKDFRWFRNHFELVILSF